MKSFDLLFTFSKVAELGSFTKAAKALRQPKSRVSRSIMRLEDEVGVQLVLRTTRSMSLTEAGKELFQSIKSPLHDLQGSLDNLTGRSQISGVLRVSTPEDMAVTLLPDIIADFRDLYPDISFEVTVSNESADLVQQNLEVAFRIGSFKDSSLVQKKLGTVKLIFVASEKYLSAYGEPKKLPDLAEHKILDFLNSDGESAFDRKFTKTDLKPNLTSTSFSLLHTLALKHRGIALLPDFYASPSIVEGKLVQILKNHEWEPKNISLVYVPTKNLPQRARAFIDFVSERVRTK